MNAAIAYCLRPYENEADFSSSVGKVCWALFAVFFFIYALTASDTVQWSDATHFMYKIHEGVLVDHLGLAVSHPLHHWMGRFVVWIAGSDPYYITLISALGGAAGVACVFGCTAALTNRLAPALFAAVSLGLANTFWRISTLTEIYTLSAALLAGTCWCVVRYVQSGSARALWLGCLLLGLGGANDVPSGLALPALVALVAVDAWQRRLAIKDACIAALAFLIGVMPYGGLVIMMLIETGDLGATLQSALFGNLWSSQVLNAGFNTRVLMTDIVFPLMNFPNLLLPAAVFGIMRARALDVPKAIHYVLLGFLIPHAIFALRYDIPEQYNFFLPLYVILAIYGGLGAEAVLRWYKSKTWLQFAAVALLAVTPVTYAVSASVARNFELLSGFERNKPYRDDYAYLMLPWTFTETSADVMSRHVLELAGDDGLVVSEDWMAYWCVTYLSMISDRSPPEMVVWDTPDASWILEKTRNAVAEGRRVILIARDRNNPIATPPMGNWERTGDLYELAP